MPRSGLWVFLLAWFAAPVWSGPQFCEGTNISINTRNAAFAELTCEAVDKANALFAQCNVPPVTAPLKIEIVEDIPDGCVALYHCGERWIEILEPPLLEARRVPGDAFAFLKNEDYYQSVIAHELAHVAFDDVPCPYDVCMAGNEYVAYAMQVMSLSPAAQDEFVSGSDLARRVSRDELSVIMLFMAPDRFAQKVWAHLSQQEDPCAFIGQIMDGSVLLDRGRF